MGSYAALKFDNVSILSSKSFVPDDIISIFQENDRRVRPDTEYTEENLTVTEYAASRGDVLFRLDVLGVTRLRLSARSKSGSKNNARAGMRPPGMNLTTILF